MSFNGRVLPYSVMYKTPTSFPTTAEKQKNSWNNPKQF